MNSRLPREHWFVTITALIIVVCTLVMVDRFHQTMVMYGNCTEAEEAGHFNISVSSPFYNPALDGDNDGVACEK